MCVCGVCVWLRPVCVLCVCVERESVGVCVCLESV